MRADAVAASTEFGMSFLRVAVYGAGADTVRRSCSAATGRGRGFSGTSSMGTLKQHSCNVLRLRSLSLKPCGYRCFGGRGLDLCFFSSRSTRPMRSASVSRLVRFSFSRIGRNAGPGLDRAEWLACSLCCQQYSVSSDGSRRLRTEGVTARRHARPADVMPRHVEDGFLESERARRDSGVLATKGIVSRQFVKAVLACWRHDGGSARMEALIRSRRNYAVGCLEKTN